MKNDIDLEYLIKIIQSELTEDLLKAEYRGNKNHYWGHCYVATEALYYMMTEDLQHNFKPATLKINNITHWFLKNIKTNEIIDVTKEQFDFKLDYTKSKRRSFLTKSPSKRCLILINRINEKYSY